MGDFNKLDFDRDQTFERKKRKKKIDFNKLTVSFDRLLLLHSIWLLTYM